jgi:hypothetical protein
MVSIEKTEKLDRLTGNGASPTACGRRNIVKPFQVFFFEIDGLIGRELPVRKRVDIENHGSPDIVPGPEWNLLHIEPPEIMTMDRKRARTGPPI